MAPPNEDDELMLRIQAGDEIAFSQLVDRHQDALIGFFYRNTRDRPLAEDLTQETLLKLHNQSWDYLPRGKFRAWLFRVARNLLIDSVRRRSSDALVRAVSSRPTDEDDIFARVTSDVVSPEQRTNTQEIVAIVDGLLEELPEEQRLTFTLHHFGELTLNEVAEILETNPATCKSRLRLAREKLKEKLARHGITDSSDSFVDAGDPA